MVMFMMPRDDYDDYGDDDDDGDGDGDDDGDDDEHLLYTSYF